MRAVEDRKAGREPLDDPLGLPKHFPRGPWVSDEAAKAEINAWCADPHTGGGGFGVVWASGVDKAVPGGSYRRGARHLLICHKHKDKCKWKMFLEDCAEGWAVASQTDHDHADAHNHPLVQSRAEANAHAVMRDIPENLLLIGKTMVAAGMRVSDVDRWLRLEVQKSGGEVTWNYMDVYHRTCASTAERKFDATDVVEHLRQRQQGQGLFYRSTTDADGCLNRLFFVMAGAHATYAVDAERQVVEFDTKVRKRCVP